MIAYSNPRCKEKMPAYSTSTALGMSIPAIPPRKRSDDAATPRVALAKSSSDELAKVPEKSARNRCRRPFHPQRPWKGGPGARRGKASPSGGKDVPQMVMPTSGHHRRRGTTLQTGLLPYNCPKGGQVGATPRAKRHLPSMGCPRPRGRGSQLHNQLPSTADWWLVSSRGRPRRLCNSPGKAGPRGQDIATSFLPQSLGRQKVSRILGYISN
jgi:hypothetical protein